MIEPDARSASLGVLEISLSIESVGFGGAGVGRLPDGRVCFVPFTLAGERAVARVVREKKSFVEAELVRLAEASVDRVQPRCPIFGKCGGCAYQHAAYSRQLAIKGAQVRDLLRRIGGLADPDVRPVLPSPSEWGYRNRISVHVAGGQVGFHGRKSHRIVPATACPIATAPVNAQLADLAMDPPRGESRITLRDRTDYRGFSQVNAAAAEALAAAVAEMLGDQRGVLVDAYCGAGFFSKKLARQFGKITGIEWGAGAVRAARSAAGANETYLEGAVEARLPEALKAAPANETSLVLDPPAEGLSPEVADTIGACRPATVVYVSCDPATLARDLKRLGSWYSVSYIQPVDLFPQTAEIESAALLKSL